MLVLVLRPGAFVLRDALGETAELDAVHAANGRLAAPAGARALRGASP
jgi:hypothetical protein